MIITKNHWPGDRPARPRVSPAVSLLGEVVPVLAATCRNVKRIIYLLAAVAVTAPVFAQTAVTTPATRARAFGWFAEFVSLDTKTNVMIVKAPIEPHVTPYILTFAPGERVVLTWSQFGGNADAVRYVASDKAMAARSGYILRGRFVGADPKARKVTIAVPVPVTVSSTLVSAKSGTPIRVTSPTAQPGPDAVLSSVALNKTAPSRPAAVAKRAASTADIPQIAGEWAINSTLSGNAVTLRCNFTQNAGKLGGMCLGPAPLGSVAVTGTINEDAFVIFSFDVVQAGASVALKHFGTLSADRKIIQGTADLSQITSPFIATRQ
jgi:hypothetical protein